MSACWQRWHHVHRVLHRRADEAGGALHKRGRAPQGACGGDYFQRCVTHRAYQILCAHSPLLQGFELARTATLAFLDSFKMPAAPEDRELLLCVARTSLRTKLYTSLADQLTEIVVDAVLTIRRPEEPIDLYMVRPSWALAMLAPAATAADQQW